MESIKNGNNMKKKNWIIVLFILAILAVIGIGVYYVFNYTNQESFKFDNDGYAIVLTGDKKTPVTYSFKIGEKYSYRKYIDTVNFDSEKKSNVAIEDKNVLHYTDNSLMPLKNVVGLDLKNISNDIIFYYNIYKSTNIKFENGEYYIKVKGDVAPRGDADDRVTFSKLLMRIDTSKFLIAANNIRLLLSDDEIIEFDKYAYFEYFDGSIVKIYNDQKNYQTISSDSKIVIDDITIDLAAETISKEGVKYISLTNLIINSDGNIDVIEQNAEKRGLGLNESMVEQPEVPDEIGGQEGNTNLVDDDKDKDKEDNNNNNHQPQQEEVVDDDKVDKVPEFKVTELSLTSLKLEAKVEMYDEDMVISGPSRIKIVENATNKTVYQEESLDSNIMISVADLKPDKEYTLIVEAPYKIDDVDYDRTFVSKIFRTKSIGLTLEKDYSKADGVAVTVTKETYSSVGSVKVRLFSSDGNILDERTVPMNDPKEYSVEFDGLESNTSYTVLLDEILVDGVTVEDGYSQKISVMTLKKAPKIGDLKYAIDKRTSSIKMSPTGVIDYDSGVRSYRYEVYDVRNAEVDSSPVTVLNKNDSTDVSLYVDGTKIERWVPYTYRLIVEFYDNEKIVEYTKDLGSTMQLDGVEFPTLRFDETYVTWEQINGVIVIDDPSGALISDEFEVVYKNSVDVYDVMKVTVSDVNGRVPINNNQQNMTVPAGTIPITINGLRKHETYTFQVYGYINLQDDAPELEKVYIGSVFVQTKDPRSLYGSFTVDTSDLGNAFAVDFRLSNEEAAFEASTLNDLSFYLYEGNSTSGTPFAFTHISDLDSAPYSSTIKRDYYDNSIRITPTFFNLDSIDFLSKKYTLIVRDAKDYTKYGNEIPVINNTIQVDINETINEFDGDPNDAITLKAILNRNASSFGMEYDENLEPTTVIGYNLLAKYNNESKKAVSVIYHAWGFDTDNGVYVRMPWLDREVPFNSNGTLPVTLYPVDYGTEGTSLDADENDTKLRRGNTYQFTFEVKILMDSNTNNYIMYPQDVDPDLTLRSKEIVISKQSSVIKMYPSSSTNTTAKWKYYVTDYDHAINDTRLYSYVGANLTKSNGVYSSRPTLTFNETEEFNEIEFTGLEANNTYGIKKRDLLVKGRDETVTILNRQWHYAVVDNLPLTFSVTPEENRFAVAIDNYYTNKEIADKIAFVDIHVNAEDTSLNLPSKDYEKVTLSDGITYVDYLDLEPYKGKNLIFTMDVHYDSGEYGYSIETDYKALQKMSIEGPGEYYYDSRKTYLELHNTLSESLFNNVELKPHENILRMTSWIGRTKNYEVEVDSAGVYYEENYVDAKAIRTKALPISTDPVSFDKILPGISIRSGSKLNISALLNTAEIRARIIVPENAEILNNDIYVELWQTDKNGGNAEHIDREGDSATGNLMYKVDDFAGPVLIDGLSPQQNYYIKFYVYENQAAKTSDTRTYLYDVDDHTSGVLYRFYTLTDVGVKNIKLSFIQNSYVDKKLLLTYNLDVIHGFDRIEYTILKWNGNTFVDSGITIGTSTNFSPLMSITIPTPPSEYPNVAWGQRFKVSVRPYGKYEVDGELREFAFVVGSSDITLPMAKTPFIGVSSIKSNNSLNFRVTINDDNHLFVNDTYTVRLVDSDYNVVANIHNNPTSIQSKVFEFKANELSLRDGETYTFNIVAEGDRLNNGNPETFVRYSKSIVSTFGDVVYLGTVSASQNQADPKKVDIIFTNSYRLSDVTSFEYFITNLSTGGFLASGQDMAFNAGNLKYNAANNFYYYTIDCTDVEGFVEDDTYLITMNFYTGNDLVEQSETSYYYGG